MEIERIVCLSLTQLPRTLLSFQGLGGGEREREGGREKEKERTVNCPGSWLFSKWEGEKRES